MNPPAKMTRIIEGKRYSVEKSTLLADDAYWDGSNHERSGRNTFLYRTPGGRYFKVNLTMWQGENDVLIPIAEDEAIDLYELHLREHHVPYEEAFPGVNVENA